MKKSSAKLSIPKLKSVYDYQQSKAVKRGDDTDPTTITVITISIAAVGGM